jgi:hypothetical protein
VVGTSLHDCVLGMIGNCIPEVHRTEMKKVVSICCKECEICLWFSDNFSSSFSSTTLDTSREAKVEILSKQTAIRIICLATIFLL